MPTKIIGYAWAPNWGWLNFGPSASPFVTIDTSNNFNGKVWSTNLGWVRMGTDLTGPASVPLSDRGNVKAVANTSGASIGGWMRACTAYTNSNDCGVISPTGEKSVAGTELGGWDGWFKLKNVVYNSVSNAYTGFAWGDLVGGWVNFSASGNTPPPVGCVPATDSNHCCPSDQIWDGTSSCVCNPAVTTCGGGPGGLTATCSVSPASTPINTNVIWTVIPSGGIGTYSYAWYENTTGIFSPLPTVLGDIASSVTKQYPTSGNYYRLVVVTSGPNMVTAQCTAGVQPGVVITDNNCKLNVITNPANAVDTRESIKLNGLLLTLANSNPITLATCNNNTLATSTPTSPAFKWREGTCSAIAPLINPLDVDVDSGVTKTICADFGGGSGDIVISGGFGVNHLLKVDKPAFYPAKSTPTATIKSSVGSINVRVDDWGGLDTAASQSNNCISPYLCFGIFDDNDLGNCIQAGNTTTHKTIDTTGGALKFYFPKYCPSTNQNKLSVFHKPAAYWTVKLKTVADKTKDLPLWFNDPDPSNKE